MNCQDNSRLKVPLPELCKTTDIGCVPITNGKPDCPPEADQLPIAYDPNAQTLWVFSCESRKWVPLTRFSLAELEEVSLDNFKTICDLLKVPVFYNPGQGTIEGHMSLGDFAAELVKCAGLSPTPTTDSKTVVAQGENVNVTSTTDGDTTTYTVSATGGGPQDSKTVLQAGNNIEITSSTSGATTTYTVNATSPQIVDQNDITKLEAGQNITLSSVTLGNTTTYTISATPPDDRNDITVVEAGNNTTVTSNKVGNVTTYTVSASGGGSGDGNDITVLEAGDNVNLETSKSGNTTTYTVSATGGGPEDSKTVLQAGTNISLTTNTQGATTTYTINASGGGGGVNQDIDMIDLPRTSEKEDVVFSFSDTNTYTQFAHYPSFIVRSRDNYFEVLEGNHEEVDLNQVAVGSSPWRKEITLTNPLDTAAIGKVELYIRLKSIVPVGDRGYINTPALVACITETPEPANEASFNTSTDIMRFDVGRNWGCLGKYTDHWATLGSLWDATVADGQSFSRLRLQGSATTNVGVLGVQSELNETTPDEDNMLHIGHSVEIPANSSKKVYIQYWLWNKVAYPAEITYQFMWETEVVPKQFFNLIGGTTPTPAEDKNDITVVEAGTGVSVTSNKVGDVTTYTVNATGTGDGNDITVVEGGTGINVTSNKVGDVTTYTLSSTVTDTNDISVVEGGTGVNVTSNKVGNTTTYTVSATNTASNNTRVVGGTNVDITSSTSGNTTTYTVNDKGILYLPHYAFTWFRANVSTTGTNNLFDTRTNSFIMGSGTLNSGGGTASIPGGGTVADVLAGQSTGMSVIVTTNPFTTDSLLQLYFTVKFYSTEETGPISIFLNVCDTDLVPFDYATQNFIYPIANIAAPPGFNSPTQNGGTSTYFYSTHCKSYLTTLSGDAPMYASLAYLESSPVLHNATSISGVFNRRMLPKESVTLYLRAWINCPQAATYDFGASWNVSGVIHPWFRIATFGNLEPCISSSRHGWNSQNIPLDLPGGIGTFCGDDLRIV